MDIYTACAILNRPSGFSGIMFEKIPKYANISYITNFGISDIASHEKFKAFMDDMMHHRTSTHTWSGNEITYNATTQILYITIWSQHVEVHVDDARSYNYMFDLLEAVRINAETYLDGFVC